MSSNRKEHRSQIQGLRVSNLPKQNPKQNIKILADISILLSLVEIIFLIVSVINLPLSIIIRRGGQQTINEVVPVFIIAELVFITSGVSGWIYGRWRRRERNRKDD